MAGESTKRDGLPPRLFTATAQDYFNAPVRSYPLPMRAMLAVVVGILWVLSKVLFRWRVEDAELLERPAGSAGEVIICNHSSMPEVVAIYIHFYLKGRRIRPIYKSEFNKIRIAAWFFPRIGALSIERGTADMGCMRAAQHALQRGEDVLIFPEGTRIKTDDQPVEIHGGFALMASMGKTDVVPMAVCGWRDITGGGTHFFRPVKCWIRAGERVGFDDAPAGLKRRARQEWLEQEAMRRVYELRDALRAEHPGRR